jgi:hypothetical protein
LTFGGPFFHALRWQRHDPSRAVLLPFPQIAADCLQIVIEPRSVFLADAPYFTNDWIVPHGITPP